MTAAVQLGFTLGARTLWRVRRCLVRVGFGLAEARRGELPWLPPLPERADGYLLTSLPADRLEALLAAHPGLTPFTRQSYARCFAELDRGFDDWLSGLSARSRSTLRRKLRRFAERSGGSLDLRCCASAAEFDALYPCARAVSALSYQERLLGRALPEGEAIVAQMRAQAASGEMRLWLLFLDGRPVSYLCAPAEGDTLLYAYLGYDPAFADLSPGTVLQAEVMRQLMEEGQFRLFDFTEGEGQHKRLFATGAVDCADLLLLRPTFPNLLLGNALALFDSAVAGAKGLGLESLARRLRR